MRLRDLLELVHDLVKVALGVGRDLRAEAEPAREPAAVRGPQRGAAVVVEVVVLVPVLRGDLTVRKHAGRVEGGRPDLA